MSTAINFVIETQAGSQCQLTDSLPVFVKMLSHYSRLFILCDENTRNYANEILNSLGHHQIQTSVLEAGEKSKSFATLERLCEQASQSLNRKSAVICVGGGVIGDLGGFFSSIFMRGIDFFLVPTSLLSMVDSSVGGKTAINLNSGKNLVGAFHTPMGIYLNREALKTLSQEHWISGLSEMLKHGLILSKAHYLRVKELIRSGNYQNNLKITDILDSIQIKQSVVEKDYKEKGMRSILNFGHTIGHALESSDGFRFAHGIYVLFGMYYELVLGESLNLTQKGLSKEIFELIEVLELDLPRLDFESLSPYLSKDKKNSDELIQFALVNEVGCVHRQEGSYTTSIALNELKEIFSPHGRS